MKTLLKNCKIVNYDKITEGNILIENDELCIPKGGWKDRYGNYFTPNPEIGKLGPLNIFFINSVDPSSYNQNLQARLNKLLKENN